MHRVGKAPRGIGHQSPFHPALQEFALIARKLTGVFTNFIAVLGAEFNAYDMVAGTSVGGGSGETRGGDKKDKDDR